MNKTITPIALAALFFAMAGGAALAGDDPGLLIKIATLARIDFYGTERGETVQTFLNGEVQGPPCLLKHQFETTSQHGNENNRTRVRGRAHVGAVG